VVGDLIPRDQAWRTGADAATQLTTSAPIELAGVSLHPGTYTLWTLPTRGGASLIINGQSGQWGTEYNADRDVARRPMMVDSLPGNVERFTIRLEPAGRLVMEWGTFQWSAPIRAVRRAS
jgi:Protein of unknown function (DUF2911)